MDLSEHFEKCQNKPPPPKKKLKDVTKFLMDLFLKYLLMENKKNKIY